MMRTATVTFDRAIPVLGWLHDFGQMVAEVFPDATGVTVTGWEDSLDLARRNRARFFAKAAIGGRSTAEVSVDIDGVDRLRLSTRSDTAPAKIAVSVCSETALDDVRLLVERLIDGGDIGPVTVTDNPLPPLSPNLG